MKTINIQKVLLEEAAFALKEFVTNEEIMQTISDEQLRIIKKAFIDIVFIENKIQL